MIYHGGTERLLFNHIDRELGKYDMNEMNDKRFGLGIG